MAGWTGHGLIRDGAERAPDGATCWTPSREVSTFPGPIPRAIKGQLSLRTRELKDTWINEAFQESPSRILLHLRDGRAVAIYSDRPETSKLVIEHVNPGGAA